MPVTFENPLAFTILNGFFESRSYISGFEASDSDVTVFKALSEGPDAAKYPHLARWYSHIASVKSLTSKAAPKSSPAKAAPAKAAAPAKEEEEDIDLFGSDDEVDEEAEKLKAQRLEEYKAKKAAKPKVIAKSMVSLDVKPWDDETDMKALEEGVRAIQMEGLVWGASKLMPVGYGIKKLQINCVIQDDLVSTEDLEDKIKDLEDYVQSVDIAAFQKL
ncbi:hypothetical protein BKA69DRAFT_1127376 [Paraphysoderma sedebokerense]|nr:hypothetical protein BKA69DRAFT_1127376 [Paraphysoderma sedebokerense]